jgi:hypothetical protein
MEAGMDPHDTWYVANCSWASADPDLPINGVKGKTRVRGSDPVYRRWPTFFDPITSSDRTAPDVEEALAVPGRKRGG